MTFRMIFILSLEFEVYVLVAVSAITILEILLTNLKFNLFKYTS